MHITYLYAETPPTMFSLSLMEHLEDPEKHVRELYRILKPNGTVVLQLPNLQYIFEPHSKWPLLCLFPKSFQTLSPEYNEGTTHSSKL